EAPTGWFPAWKVAVGGLQVLAVHLRPALSVASGFHRSFFATGAVRRLEIETYLERLDAAPPTVVLGGFNEAEGPALATLRAPRPHPAVPSTGGVFTPRFSPAPTSPCRRPPSSRPAPRITCRSSAASGLVRDHDVVDVEPGAAGGEEVDVDLEHELDGLSGGAR